MTKGLLDQLSPVDEDERLSSMLGERANTIDELGKDDLRLRSACDGRREKTCY